MKGFNLFAAFLGAVMLAVAVGFSAYTFQEERATIREISARAASQSAGSIADLIRQDAHNTVVESIRRGFQNFFLFNDLDPPDSVWTDEGEFREWFSRSFVRSGRLTQFLADYIAEELLLYQNLPLKGHTVRVVVNRKGLREALAKGADIEFREDGTFAFVYDTSALEPEDVAKLPAIVVDGTETVSVFPPGRWRVPVPLRILEAYRRAKAFRERVEGNIDEFKVLFGSCDLEKSPACGVYAWEGRPVPRYPREIPESIKVVASEVGKGTWTAYNLTSGACGDLALAVGGELNALPLPAGLPDHIVCSVYAETVLYGLLQKRLSQLVEGEWESAVIRPETIQRFRTWRIFTQRAVSVPRLLDLGVFPPLQWLLDALPGAQIVPLSPCRPSGYMYCAVPVQLAYVYTWVDPDTNYSVTGKYAAFSFRQVFRDPFNDIYSRYRARDETVKRIVPESTGAVAVRFDMEECEEQARRWCADHLIRAYEQCVRLELEKRREELGDRWEWLEDLLAGRVDVGEKIEEICSSDVMRDTVVCSLHGMYAGVRKAEDPASMPVWERVREAGNRLYLGYAEEHRETGSRVAGECMHLFRAFKDENAPCTDTNRNFCGHLGWLENGIPGACPERKYVAYSVFWFHPFDEFAATCTANRMPEGPR